MPPHAASLESQPHAEGLGARAHRLRTRPLTPAAYIRGLTHAQR